jgi:hypothetical protein
MHADVGKRIAGGPAYAAAPAKAANYDYKSKSEGRVIALQMWIRKELDTLDRERCPSFSASSACERKVFCPECLIEKILLVIGFF